MVEHIVVMKSKPETTEEQKKDLVKRLQSLKDKIPGIITASAGINFVADEKRNLGFSAGLVVKFESREALNNYLPHPAHLEVVEYLRQVMESWAVIDYEC